MNEMKMCPHETPVTSDAYREAMSGLAAAVNLVTTDGPAGRAGFTATAVCSVTDAPPTLLVCVRRDSSVSAVFQTNEVLCVNTLAVHHRPVADLFGGRTPVDTRFAAARWRPGGTGSPILVGASAWFDCRIAQVMNVGTHAVLFCSVLEVGFGKTREKLVYVGRAYAVAAHLSD